MAKVQKLAPSKPRPIPPKKAKQGKRASESGAPTVIKLDPDELRRFQMDLAERSRPAMDAERKRRNEARAKASRIIICSAAERLKKAEARSAEIFRKEDRERRRTRKKPSSPAIG